MPSTKLPGFTSKANAKARRVVNDTSRLPRSMAERLGRLIRARLASSSWLRPRWILHRRMFWPNGVTYNMYHI